jgi:phosphoribosyl 1,2-cyclic phosphodiesterase
MIDCGEDWLGRVERLAPDAIVLTHAHPDHARGLERGAPCSVHATEASWVALADYPLRDRRVIKPRRPAAVGGITFEAFPVDHSLRAPAVGYRLSAGGVTAFYVPDVVAIGDRAEALAGVALFVGDGATLTRSMVRRRGTVLIGHTPVRTQLGSCEREGVSRAVFSHCGTEIVAGDERRLGARLRALARERGLTARFAHDGMEIDLPAGRGVGLSRGKRPCPNSRT